MWLEDLLKGRGGFQERRRTELRRGASEGQLRQPLVAPVEPSSFMMHQLDDTGRLRTSMRVAFGRPQGTVAIMSICTKLQNKEHMIEALRRAKFKFPGHQKVHISKKWGFTEFNADDFEDMVAEKWLIPDGSGVTYIPRCGPLEKWRALHS
ncbi:60S ribosomal protein L10-like [Sapajus apella]|uniref:60S ribosomal protein L10-like n=1 Tax=Sapajus apella TaxID=9515 RepID=A0A6J3HPV4_SAPAP|nr:60S ribosomal protein L10-like [Sapajus apella]